MIAAFNSNMPFNEFAHVADGRRSAAADADATKEQTLATAFLRVGKRTTENGAIDEEYRVEYVVDRTNTIGTAFLGMTVGCARCHDHKYDPISHKDFYSLSAFFNSTDEPGFYAPGRTGITPGRRCRGPMPRTDAKIAAAEAVDRGARSRATRRAVAAARDDASAPTRQRWRRPAADSAAAVRSSLEQALVAHYPFEETAAGTGRPVAAVQARQSPAGAASPLRAAQTSARQTPCWRRDASRAGGERR